MRATVYKATNAADGHFYIGVTTLPLQKRRGQHLWNARNRNTYPLAVAIRETGARSFLWESLASFATVAEALDEEVRLIATLQPAYNVMPGGIGRKVVCLDDGHVYPSAAAAAEAYGAKKSAVTEVCLRRPFRRIAAGRVFRYYGDHHGGWAEGMATHRQPPSGGDNPYKGVHRHISDGKDTGRWRARISVGARGRAKKLSLGIFDTAEEAYAAYAAAKARMMGAGHGAPA